MNCCDLLAVECILCLKIEVISIMQRADRQLHEAVFYLSYRDVPSVGTQEVWIRAGRQHFSIPFTRQAA